MSIQFDIDELKTFVLLAENGHFTETAQTLGISQPAVSQRIARLENTFGLMLFTRSAERAVLTSYGEKVLDCARRCVESHEAMGRRLTQQQRSFAGRVRVWIDHSTQGEKLAAALEQRIPDHVQVERVDSRTGSPWSERLRHFECDLAFSGVFLQSDPPLGLKRIELRREAGLSAMWAPHHYQMSPEAFNLADVLGTTLLVGSERLVPGFRHFVEDWCRRAYGATPADILEFDTAREAFQACQAGYGISLSPGSSEAPFDSSGLSVEKRALFSEVLPNAYAYGLHMREGEKNEAVTEMASWLVEAYKQIPA
ncbi:LysR family transcriptional regulator [Luteolibacter ambystomatis]|uniref:LysR family transcriptional regulator n=1 Tax=Luteolibacter ambystomatis TaxID=2824561 RepID=A0A975IYN5_9BACT|nr:LysR family transcriptional regulator [Luteolibacter ambystomatis]QUE50417.1 LysR family transcriptional regulator [Luteolibacter ambystomatis]